MKTLRNLIRNLLIVLIFLLILAVASMIQDSSETRRDNEIEGTMLVQTIKNYAQDKDPIAIIYEFIGSTETKEYHRFTSDCALKIRSWHIVGFDTEEEAIKAGYSRCPVCFP